MADQYKALYNIYRPTTIEKLVGQDHITHLIKSQLESKLIPNSLILYGNPGTGKTTLGRIIANVLNPNSCGLLEIDSALDGSKDFIKSIQQDIYNVPYMGEYKTYIFDESHELSKKSFASLLKTLEEPPPHVKFIFITNNFDKIPLNIKSRSQSHHFSLIPYTEVKKRLLYILDKEAKKVTEDLLNLAIYVGGGSLRDSIVALDVIITCLDANLSEEYISDVLGVLGNRRVSKFVHSYLVRDFFGMLEHIKGFYSESIDSQKAISELQQFIMDFRLFITSPSLVKTIKTNVTEIVSLLEGSFKKNIEKLSVEDRKKLGASLDKIYDLSVNTESLLFRVQNKEPLFKRFVINLATTWY